MNRKTIITFSIILLIFLYWRKKRSKIGLSCAELWENMANDRAEELFVNTLSMVNNDTDIKNSILAKNPDETQLDYNKCLYAAKYLYEREIPAITLLEKGKIEKCICEKHNV